MQTAVSPDLESKAWNNFFFQSLLKHYCSVHNITSVHAYLHSYKNKTQRSRPAVRMPLVQDIQAVNAALITYLNLSKSYCESSVFLMQTWED